jgi:hypothetical protein
VQQETALHEVSPSAEDVCVIVDPRRPIDEVRLRLAAVEELDAVLTE